MNTTTERPTQPARRGVSLAKTPVVVDLRDIPEYFDLHAHAASAALYAGTLGLPAPVDLWTGMSTGHATALLPDGTRLVHHPAPRQQIVAHRLCRHDRWHSFRVEGALSLAEFVDQATNCTRHDLRAQRAMALGMSLVKATQAAADTQAMHLKDIRTGLQQRRTADRPKEHPQP